MSSHNGARIQPGWIRKLISRSNVASLLATRLPSLYYYYTRKDKQLFPSRIRSVDLSSFIDPSNHPNLNVIIITVDSLRNANLSCTGYFRQTTPFLDSMNVRFKALSASPWTYPSVASLLTGLYPHNHGALLHGLVKNIGTDLDSYAPLRSHVVSLPEILHVLGYRIHFHTAIEMAYLPLRSRVIAHQYNPIEPAETLSRSLKRCIQRGNERQFVYLHLADLHSPLKIWHGTILKIPNDYKEFFGRDENWQTMYDNALRYIDAAIERLFDYLSDSRLLDRTVVVITGDHGEELGEHAELESAHFYDPRGSYGSGHGHNVFREIIEVPLIFAGAVPAKVTDSLVSTVDVVPTVLDLIQVGHRFHFDGRSVFAKADPKEIRPLLCEACGYGYEKKALVVGHHKLIYSKEDGIEWVFNLNKDPLERCPITDPQVTSPLLDMLQLILREDERLRIREAMRRTTV